MGRVTFAVGDKELPATNVDVTSVPEWCGSAKTDASGDYELGSGCPIGVYTIVFSGPGYETVEVPNISITAGQELILNQQLVAKSPITLSAPRMPNPAGFGQQITLGVTATGGTEPYTYLWKPRPTNPTSVALSATDVAAPTFTTGTLADIIAGKKVIGFGPSRGTPELLGVSTQQLSQLTYNFDVVVTDAIGFTRTLTVAVPTATLSQGITSVPTGTLVIVSIPGNTTPVTLAPLDGQATVPTVNDAAGPYPWFVASQQGRYTLGGLRVVVSNYRSSSPYCGGCHEPLMTAEEFAAYQEKFKQWDDSAHGNHFFKLMEYDASGALVWKKGADGKPLPAATANPTVFWTEPGRMTTFEFGMTGAEGTHYGASCVACHTTGYNLAIDSGGFDDVARAAGWTFPDLTSIFTDLTQGTAGADSEPVTPAPQLGAWEAIPAAAKAFAGMQCESCHGPVDWHASHGNAIPVGQYSTAACAVCHDRPNNHDRVALWRRSGHANVQLAVDDGTRASCGRCHSAQGFAKYAEDTTVSEVTFSATAADVQPQTCAACHDSHLTTVRITGEDPAYVAAGFTVYGAGTGALCMTCHNGRRGLKGGDIAMTSFQVPHPPTQTEVLMGMNAYFLGNAAGFSVSGHAAVAETCVGCHMKTPVSGLRFTNTNHTFGFKDDLGNDQATSICAECHGEEVNGEAIEEAYDRARQIVMAQLGATIEAAVAGTAGFTVTPVDQPGHDGIEGTTFVLPLASISSISVDEATLVFTLAAPIDVTFPSGTISTSTVYCGAANLMDATGTFDLLDVNGVVSKAMWNLGLVHDGSGSIHNPTFVFDVLQATEAALREATPAAACAATCL